MVSLAKPPARRSSPASERNGSSTSLLTHFGKSLYGRRRPSTKVCVQVRFSMTNQKESASSVLRLATTPYVLLDTLVMQCTCKVMVINDVMPALWQPGSWGSYVCQETLHPSFCVSSRQRLRLALTSRMPTVICVGRRSNMATVLRTRFTDNSGHVRAPPARMREHRASSRRLRMLLFGISPKGYRGYLASAAPAAGHSCKYDQGGDRSAADRRSKARSPNGASRNVI